MADHDELYNPAKRSRLSIDTSTYDDNTASPFFPPFQAVQSPRDPSHKMPPPPVPVHPARHPIPYQQEHQPGSSFRPPHDLRTHAWGYDQYSLPSSSAPEHARHPNYAQTDPHHRSHPGYQSPSPLPILPPPHSATPRDPRQEYDDRARQYQRDIQEAQRREIDARRVVEDAKKHAEERRYRELLARDRVVKLYEDHRVLGTMMDGAGSSRHSGPARDREGQEAWNDISVKKEPRDDMDTTAPSSSGYRRSSFLSQPPSPRYTHLSHQVPAHAQYHQYQQVQPRHPPPPAEPHYHPYAPPHSATYAQSPHIAPYYVIRHEQSHHRRQDEEEQRRYHSQQDDHRYRTQQAGPPFERDRTSQHPSAVGPAHIESQANHAYPTGPSSRSDLRPSHSLSTSTTQSSRSTPHAVRTPIEFSHHYPPQSAQLQSGLESSHHSTDPHHRPSPPLPVSAKGRTDDHARSLNSPYQRHEDLPSLKERGERRKEGQRALPSIATLDRPAIRAGTNRPGSPGTPRSGTIPGGSGTNTPGRDHRLGLGHLVD